MNQRLLLAIVIGALGAVIGSAARSVRADDVQQQQQLEKHLQQRHEAMQKRMAIQAEIADKPQGIHKLSDGSFCIKSGTGLATVHSDGRGCGTGCFSPPVPAVPDSDLMSGVFYALLMNPQEGANIGITADQSKKVLAAYGYSDYEGTDPSAVLNVYNAYAKAPEGKAKIDAEKALMDKVKAVGEAYINAEAKKLKDVKALLNPAQIGGLREMGAKFVRPFEKPVA